MADGDHIRNGGFIVRSIRGTQDEVIFGIRQFVVIPKDNIGLVCFRAVTGYGIVSPDQVVVLAVFQFRIETFNIVQLGRICTIFSTAAFNRVAHAGDLGHIGIIHSVAAAHDHDLAAALRNSILQGCCHFFRITYAVVDGTDFRSINRPVGICHRVACAVDDGRVGVRSHVPLADDAVGCTAECFVSIRIHIDVEGAIGQGGCTPEIQSPIAVLVNDTGIGTGYRGSQTSRIGVSTGGQAASASGSFILSIAQGSIKAKAGHIRTIDRVVLDIVCGIVQGIRIGFHLGVQSRQVLTCRFICRNVI